jgi:hypothetical protein
MKGQKLKFMPIEHRVRAAPLNHHEQQQAGHRQSGPTKHGRCGKAARGALGDEVDQGKHRQGQGGHAGDVEAMGRRVAGLLHADAQQSQSDQGEWHMHQEHPAPIRDGQDQRTHHRPETQAHTGDHAPHRKGPRPRRRFAELVRQDRELADHHRPGTHALDKTRRNQRGGIIGQPTGQRRQPEYPQAQHQHAPPTKAIGQSARRHQHAGAGQGVGVHDPLGVLEAGAQLLFKGGQDDRHAGNLQPEHQRHQAHGGEREAVPGGA